MQPPSVTGLLVRRLRWVLAVQLGTLAVATIGFVALAHFDWFDALYMSVITLGTIGYGEVQPLDTVGRTWAMLVIAGGFGALVYSGAAITSLLLSGDLSAALQRQRSARMLDRLQGHVIVVGFGRVGRSVVQAVLQHGRACVVVDADPAKGEAIRAAGAVPLCADGMQEDTLRAAGIDTARALVAAGPDDPANLVITLTARALRTDLRIVSRVNDTDWHQRIERAGASAVMSPYGDFGAGLAASALGADVVETHELGGYGLRTQDIIVGAGSPIIGRRPDELVADHPGVTLLAMRRASTETPWDKVDDELRAGDVLVVLGPDDVVVGLESRLGV